MSKQFNSKILLSTSPRKGHTEWCNTKIKRVQQHWTVKQTVCNGHPAWFDPQMKKLEPHCKVKQTVPQYSTEQ